MKVEQPTVELLHYTPAPEKIIERAGRICWKSEERITDESHIAFIKMLKSKEHASVLEHASAGFIVSTDRGISHEIVRHRIASYSQSSTRYCNYSKDKFGNEITVMLPSGVEPGTPVYSAWEASCLAAEAAYFQMLKEGAKPEIARSVLPTCLKTELVWTANLREWLHICSLRGSKAAHPDVRKVIEQIKPLLYGLAPVVFEDFQSK